MAWLQAITLHSSRVTLEPLDHRHREQPIEAVKDGDLLKLWYTSVPAPDLIGLTSICGWNSKPPASLPFAVIDNATGKAAGMTIYLRADAVNRRLQIGGTWYRQSVQRTDLNTHAKLLLFGHAFETLHCLLT